MTPASQPSGTAMENPFFQSWDTPFGAPPFARIKPEHFLPAYARAFAEHQAEIDKIASQKAAPTFDNTIVALENAGRALQRVDDLFGQIEEKRPRPPLARSGPCGRSGLCQRTSSRAIRSASTCRSAVERRFV